MNIIELRRPTQPETEDDLQIVVIDNFYDAAIRNEGCEWLGKLFQFKVTSFLESYPYGMLSFGTTDLIGTHCILCRKTTTGLQPLMGIKMIDSERLETFRMAFPGLEPVSAPGLEAHRKAVEHELAKNKKAGHRVGYVGSWVAAPEVRKDKSMAAICKKISTALISRWFIEFDIRTAIAFASIRFHVEKYHKYLGLTRLTGPGGEHLPDFKMHSAFDELLSASVFYRANHSTAALQDMADYQALWDKRIVMASERSPLFQQKPVKVAA